MSNKDNQNSQPIFNEDITKNLVKKILDDNVENNIEEDTRENTDSFNIEYEKYDDYDEYEDYDDGYDEYEEETERRYARREKPKNKRENQYRKNIEMYGKDFFDDEDDYGYDESPSSIIGKVISFSIIIVLTISTTFLAFSLVKTKNELTEAKAQIEELLDDKVETENKIAEEALKNENESLKAENESLKANSGEKSTDKATEQTTVKNNNTNNTTTGNTSSNNSNNSTVSEYIVKEGDVIWNISKQVYGNGAHYQKILDANKLTENSVLKPGQKLIIPKLN